MVEQKIKITSKNMDIIPRGKENVEKVLEIITQNNLNAEIWAHPHTPVTRLQTHLDLYGGTANEVLKCLCLVSKNRPLVIMASGEIKIDMNKLQKISHLKDIRMAKPDELLYLFKRNPGEVDPLSIPKNIPVYADKKLFEKKEVVGSAGSPYAGLKLNPSEILKVQNPIIEDFAEVSN